MSLHVSLIFQIESSHPEIENHLVKSGDYQTVVNLEWTRFYIHAAGCYKFKLICQQETVDLYIYLLFIYALSISLNYSKSTRVILIGGNRVRITCENSMSPVVAKLHQI